jgi:hypothetical protein
MIMDTSMKFQSGQIVSLDDVHRTLYGEVIEVVISRQLCWVRPWLLVDYSQEEPLITDVRDVSDILWPLHLFRAALDTEVITLLSHILPKDFKGEPDVAAQREFNLFIHQIWHSYQHGQ